MNRTWCERERDVVRELRVGAVSPQLLQHLRSCAVCAETHAVAEVMLQAASLRSAECGLPDAGLVWRRVETRRKEIALKRAAWPLIFMRTLSAVWVAIFGAWFLHYFWRAGFVELFPNRNVLASESAFLAALIAVLAIVIGAGYLLHDSRRSVEGIAST